MNNNSSYSSIQLRKEDNNSEGTIYYEAKENSFEIEQEKKGLSTNGFNSIIYHNKHNRNINNNIICPNDIKSQGLNQSNIFFETKNQFNEEKSFNNKIPKTNISNNNSPSSIHSSKNLPNLFNTNSMNENISLFFPLKITTINFRLDLDKLDLSFLASRRRSIIVKNKNMNNDNRNCRTVIELQNFYISQHPIWSMSISHDGCYLAIGTKKGKLFILEIINYTYNDYQPSYNQNTIMTYLNFVNERPKRVYNEHTEDVIDINWSQFTKTQLLTASIDHYVILWDITSESSIRKYYHDGIVTSVSFHPINQKAFASGCLDKIVRFWSIDSNNSFEYFNIKEKIVSFAFFPNGESIAVGTHNGKIIIYDLIPKTLYNSSFSCKNRIGKNSFGKKVTCIEFCDKNTALISTSDSRIRLVTIPDGKMIHKYKGHKNEEGILRAHCDNIHDIVISPSEDGNVFLWNKYNKDNGRKKNYGCEYFKAFAKEIVHVSRIPSDLCSANYIKKVYKATNKLFVFNIIINGTNKGRIQILLNLEETNKQ